MTLFRSEDRHDWDYLTEACTKCGGMRHVIHNSDNPLRCLGGGNVVGLTHRRLRQTFRELLGESYEGLI